MGVANFRRSPSSFLITPAPHPTSAHISPYTEPSLPACPAEQHPPRPTRGGCAPRTEPNLLRLPPLSCASGHSACGFCLLYNFLLGVATVAMVARPTIERILTLTRSGSTTAVRGSTGARRGAPQTRKLFCPRDSLPRSRANDPAPGGGRRTRSCRLALD